MLPTHRWLGGDCGVVRTRGPREAPRQPASGNKENAKMPNPNGKWKVEFGNYGMANQCNHWRGDPGVGPEIGIARLPKPESRPSRRQRRQG
jgi:hypothetical protein